MSKVYIEHRNVKYPSSAFNFAPSEKYPEYRWDDISNEPNEVYDMVRECLRGYGFDSNRFGKVDWNPLGDIIHEGDIVVIKPNWVQDRNENRKGGIDCLVTNASIIRAMIDYVYIALNDTGRIIVGDSPVPACDFEKLMHNAKYNSIWDSCRKRGIEIDIADFREDIVTGFANKVKLTDGQSEKIIDLGKYSLFSEVGYKSGRFRNGVIDATKMNNYYHTLDGHHKYGVNKLVLQSDVIINLPKPKTHRKAGYTAALKNYIGICSRKSSIPHNVMGNVREGGDTYYGPKIVFETEQRMRDVQNRLQAENRHILGTMVKCLRTPFWLFRRVTHRYFFGTGNWYQNDTIWRSILDLNRIMIYVDKDGRLCDTPQRRFFSMGDMVTAGHRNGPMAPTPIDIGVILCSEDPVAFDRAVINLMGLNYARLPVLNKIQEVSKYPIRCECANKIVIVSNEEKLAGKCIEDMPVAPYGFFEPAEGWEIISRKGETEGRIMQ